MVRREGLADGSCDSPNQASEVRLVAYFQRFAGGDAHRDILVHRAVSKRTQDETPIMAQPNGRSLARCFGRSLQVRNCGSKHVTVCRLESFFKRGILYVTLRRWQDDCASKTATLSSSLDFQRRLS